MRETSSWFSLGGESAQICHVGSHAANLVSLLLGGTSRAKARQATVRFRVSDEDGNLNLWCNDRRVLHRAPADIALRQILNLIGFHLVEPCAAGLMLHTAAVARHGRAILLPGGTHAGKSTLAAWFLAKGFDYLTDELAYIPLGKTTVNGLGRPLHIRADARPAVQTLLAEAHRGGVRKDFPRGFVPHASFGSRYCSTAEVSTMLFPQFERNSKAALIPLTKGQATMRLFTVLVNARNLPRHGAHDVRRLVNAVPAYRLSYSAFNQLEPTLDRLFRE